MKFKTADLIARVDILVAERIAEGEAAHAKRVEDIATGRQTWLDEKGPAYVLFANRIKDKIRKGRPILRSDIPQELVGRYDGIEVFRGSEAAPKKTPVPTGDLTTLKAALEAVADEYVTTAGLREIGFKDIAKLFRTEK